MARARRESYLAPQTDNGHGVFRTAGATHVPSATPSPSPSPPPPSDSSALPVPRDSTHSSLQPPLPALHLPHRLCDPYPYSTAQTAIGHDSRHLDVPSQMHSSHEGPKVGPPLADPPSRKSMSEIGHGPVTFAPFTPSASDSDLGHYDEYIKFYHGELASNTQHALRLRYERQLELDGHDHGHDVRADFPPGTRYLDVDTNPITPARSNSVMSMLPSMPQSRCQEHRASGHGFVDGLKRALSGQAHLSGRSSSSLGWRSPSPHSSTGRPVSAGRATKSARSDSYLDALVMHNPDARSPRKLKRRSNRMSLPPTESEFFFVENLNGSASMEKHASVEWQPYDSRTSVATAPSPELFKRSNRKLTKKRQSMGNGGVGWRTSSKPSLLPTVEAESPEPTNGDAIDTDVFKTNGDEDSFSNRLPLIPRSSSLDVREIMADRSLSPPLQELRTPYANPQEHPWAPPIGIPSNATNYSHALYTPRNVEQEQTQTPSFSASPERKMTVEGQPLAQHGRAGPHGRSHSQPPSLQGLESAPSGPPTAGPLNSNSPADGHGRDPSNHSHVGSLIDRPGLERRVSRRRWTLNIAGEEIDDDILRQELERLRSLGEEPDQQRAHTPNGAAVKEAAWKMQKRALLSSRQVILTERSYLLQLTRFHSTVIGGYPASYCPDMLLEHLPPLMHASRLFSSFMEEDPSVWGVSAAFISAADVLERALVAYCAVAGEVTLKCRKAGSSSNQGYGISPWSGSGHHTTSNSPVTDELGGQQQSSVTRSHSTGIIGRRRWRKSLPGGAAAPTFAFGFGMSASSTSVPPSSYAPPGAPPSRSSSNAHVHHSDPSSSTRPTSAHSGSTTIPTPVTSHSGSSASTFAQGKLRANMTASEIAVQPTQRATRYVLLYRGTTRQSKFSD